MSNNNNENKANSKEQEIDTSLLDLFLIEVDNNTKMLEEGLLKAEQDQTPERMEPLMRAAHSIKGACRIIGFNQLVELAHSMEDVLSAVQKGKYIMTNEDIEQIIVCNDFFKELGKESIDSVVDFVKNQEPRVQQLESEVGVIKSNLSGNKVITVPIINEKIIQKKETPSEQEIIHINNGNQPNYDIIQPKQTAIAEVKSERQEERIVRVMADNLNKLMGLTGESLVQSKSIKPFSDSLLKIDNSILDMIRTSDATLQDLESEEMNNEIRQKLIECNMEFKKIHESFVSHIEKFEFYTRRVENLTDRLYYEVIAIRMKPFSEGLHGFPRLVRDVSKTLGKKVRLEIIGEFTRVDRDILEKLESPLNHLIRNAVDHGIEMPEDRIAAGKPVEGVITLEARHSAGTLIISVKDDGKGIDPDKLRKKIVEKGYAPSDLAANLSNAELMDFLFLPGFSTAEAVTEISGRGVGLDVVFSMVHEVSGTLRAESIPGQGSTFYLQLPLTLSVIRTLLVDIAGEPYAIPLARIDRIMKLKEKDLLTLEDQQYCIYNETNVGIVDSYQVFERSNNGRKDDLYNIVIVSDRLNRYGIVVDSFLGQRSLVVIPIDQKLGRIPNIAAGAILEDGEPVLILDVDDLVRSIDNMLTRGKLKKLTGRSSEEELKQKRILVVDDSLTVREVERKLLENNGYEVVLAVDGIDGWNALHREQFDLLISDVDMPRMNGIELVTRVKSDSNLKRMPVMIVSYKDREEDRMRGLEAGANYYFTKSSFHDEKLISAVHDLIGEAR